LAALAWPVAQAQKTASLQGYFISIHLFIYEAGPEPTARINAAKPPKKSSSPLIDESPSLKVSTDADASAHRDQPHVAIYSGEERRCASGRIVAYYITCAASERLYISLPSATHAIHPGASHMLLRSTDVRCGAHKTK
jgi:hypothetical protein